jgi:hypothetical protein
MSTDHIDYTDRINKFLLLKKNAGLDPSRIKIYLNLLKFFVEHLASKGTNAEVLEDPVNTVLAIKFEGIDDTIQQDYLNLFLDFVSYVKRPAQFAEAHSAKPKQASGPSAVNRSQSLIEQKLAAASVNCPKCGHNQNRRDNCSKCGAPMLTIVKGFSRKESIITNEEPDKKNLVVLGCVLLLAAILAAYYFYPTKKESKKAEATKIQVEILVDKYELEKYVAPMKGCINDIGKVSQSWDKMDILGDIWKDDHEIMMANFSMIRDKLAKLTPPKEIAKYHLAIKDIVKNIVDEMSMIKTNLNAGEKMPIDASRTGRAFNTINVLVTNLEGAVNDFETSVSSICKYNNARCKL